MKTYSLKILILTAVVAFVAGAGVSYMCVAPSKQTVFSGTSSSGSGVIVGNEKPFKLEW